MTITRRSLVRLCTLTAALVVGVLARAEAGPPLICNPFPTLGTASLPWLPSGNNWEGVDHSYDVSRLTADTLHLLAPEMPVIARMETMRRAAIYGVKSPQIGAQLVVALLGRAKQADLDGRSDTLAWFDAGYFVETMREAIVVEHRGEAPERAMQGVLGTTLADVGGYAWVQRALATPAATPDMQLAASLMTRGAASKTHLARAAAQAVDGSTLADLIVYFDGSRRTLADIRAQR